MVKNATGFTILYSLLSFLLIQFSKRFLQFFQINP
jgi:hypothetical protein